MNACPVCGSRSKPKFDRASDWCVACVEGELAVQAELDEPVQDREIIGS